MSSSSLTQLTSIELGEGGMSRGGDVLQPGQGLIELMRAEMARVHGDAAEDGAWAALVRAEIARARTEAAGGANGLLGLVPDLAVGSASTAMTASSSAAGGRSGEVRAVALGAATDIAAFNGAMVAGSMGAEGGEVWAGQGSEVDVFLDLSRHETRRKLRMWLAEEDRVSGAR